MSRRTRPRGAFLVPYYCFFKNGRLPEGSARILFLAFRELGWSYDDFYSTNLVKCPTKNNADPPMGMADRCGRFIRNELEIEQSPGAIVFGEHTARMASRIGLKIPFVKLPHPYAISRKFTRFSRFVEDLERARMKIEEAAKIHDSRNRGTG